MQSEHPESIYIDERRLVGTLLTAKPSAQAFIVASLTTLIMTLSTLYFWTAAGPVADLLPAASGAVFERKEIWRLFTAIFIHADLEHLLSNLYMLWIFSFFVFGYFGLGIFPTLSFLLAGVTNALAIVTYAPDVRLLGASGLVYILGGFWLAIYPFIQRQYSVVNRIVRMLGIGFVIFLPTTFVPTVSYRTHAIGFALGALMGVAYFFANKKFIRSREFYKVTRVEELVPGHAAPEQSITPEYIPPQ